MRAGFTALLIAASAVACAAADVRPPGAGEATRLTPAAAIVEISLGPVPEGSAILALDIGAVSNPRLRPVSVNVALTDAARRVAPIPVSTVSLFPSGQPGRFLLRATRAVDQLRRETGESRPAAIARLELAETDRSVPGADELVLGEIRVQWMREPGE